MLDLGFIQKILNPNIQTHFIKNDNYYFNCLSQSQKDIYNRILSGLQRLDREISIPRLSTNEIFMIFNRVLLDNPLIFYVTQFKVSSGMMGSQSSFVPIYKYDRRFIEQSSNTILSYLQNFDKIKNNRYPNIGIKGV
ncbi:MAG: hypothetical protein FWG98_05455 [Candidatus Cloacimonetes bacterium]|nr:hypothetical protein [Candidatus Cloacimonadota bacterium]